MTHSKRKTKFTSGAGMSLVEGAWMKDLHLDLVTSEFVPSIDDALSSLTLIPTAV